MGLPTPIVILAWLVGAPLMYLRAFLLKVPIIGDLVNSLYKVWLAVLRVCLRARARLLFQRFVWQPRISVDEEKSPVAYRAAQLEVEKKNNAVVGVECTHHFFEAEEGLFLHYAACGDENKPIMIFLHGSRTCVVCVVRSLFSNETRRYQAFRRHGSHGRIC